ncbi:TetR/AcrR family transcriptional regulator [Phenylobacterium terrae]|uniref:TetR/AcrR family transcriptional regulator n=1 Tax=Phenylobacterium terrae TaxID=2665495 RepID=A0ABW4MZR2_9CAUL
MRTRLKRVEQVERNRELVLEAARRVFLEKGYAGASVEEIAEAAGFSRGVVYSQFGGKGDMFMALLETRIAERAAENEAAAARLDGPDAVRQVLALGEADARREPRWQMLLIEFRIQAARDPVLGARYAAAHRQTIARLAKMLQAAWARSGREPALPPDEQARLILAMGSGLTLERAADPEALPEAVGAPALLRLLGA